VSVFAVGDRIKVDLHTGRIVEAAIKAVINRTDGPRLQVDLGKDETALMVTIDTPKVTQPKDTDGFSSKEMNVLQGREAQQLCAAKELVHGGGNLLSVRAELAGRYNKWQTALSPSTVSSELQMEFTRILLIPSTSDRSRRGLAAL
jgi:hypothetical protein